MKPEQLLEVVSNFLNERKGWSKMDPAQRNYVTGMSFVRERDSAAKRGLPGAAEYYNSMAVRVANSANLKRREAKRKGLIQQVGSFENSSQMRDHLEAVVNNFLECSTKKMKIKKAKKG